LSEVTHSVLNNINQKKLRRWLLLFFFALAIPSGLLVYQAFDQLKWEAFHRHRGLAEELANRIDKGYTRLIETEERRAFADYNFLIVAGDPKSNFIQRSALSEFPVKSPIPGLIGYFQVDNEGIFKTPLLPDSTLTASEYGIQANELQQRQTLADHLRAILGENQLVSTDQINNVEDKFMEEMLTPEEIPLRDSTGPLFSSPMESNRSRDRRITSENDKMLRDNTIKKESTDGQAAFDRLSEQNTPRSAKALTGNILGRIEDLQLDSSFETAKQPIPQQRTVPKMKAKLTKRASRKERGVLPELESLAKPPTTMSAPQTSRPGPLRIRTFESEIDPFEMSLLNSGHIVLYRKVWRDNQRYIQGILVEQGEFLSGIMETGFRDTSLAQMSELITAYQGNLLAAFSASNDQYDQPDTEDLRGALLYQTRLSAPLNDLELIFAIQHLPAGPGGTVIGWIAVILFLLLSAGFFAIYRLGIGQIKLLTQQQDFVSAVSHELKTPLTSIRMYGEMLREGWVVEDKRREYYNYIHDESERLTRLINNVLQLARMRRNELQVQVKSITAGELMDMIGSKIESQVNHAGFSLNLTCPNECNTTTLQIDPDYFTQIIINLVDNAIKFSSRADTKTIDITCQQETDNHIVFKVRDYGPGIAKDQMKKIFKLFYRTENELTRETVGTGIGLSLVNQLAIAMAGSVEVVNREPGAEFQISFSPPPRRSY
jgi:signal transduction histidine kinase